MKYYFLTIQLLFLNVIFSQNNCPNHIVLKQLGVEFCLPDKDWTMVKEDGLKFISISKASIYWGVDNYTLRTEKISQNISSENYFEQKLDKSKNAPDNKKIIISKGKKDINGKEFYYCKSKTVTEETNTYSITYFYCDQKIGYTLDYELSDENIDKWNENEALKIWSSFKIISLPADSIFD